jgi:hypothetical protein
MDKAKIYSEPINPTFMEATFMFQTYWTPDVIAKFIESEKIKSIIANPPYDVR